MIEFIDDDLSYLAWVAAHPDSYVLNVRRLPDPRYVVLHRANCKSISNETHASGAYTARGYRKICMSSEAMLQAAAKREGRSVGTPSKALLKAHPHLTGLVLDLPEVFNDRTKLWATKLGLENRCAYVVGDMFKQVPNDVIKS